MEKAIEKYAPFRPVMLSNRQWPDRRTTRAPTWCSVDLRDGNQALADPMRLEAKLEYFAMLVSLGFKQIEVGFPSASQTEFDEVRALIELGRIPDDVTIQVLVQAREHLIRRTFEALAGAPRVILHLYSATSPLYRNVVFRRDWQGVVDMTLEGARLIRSMAADFPGEVIYEYSPEFFNATEPDKGVEICARVAEAFGASRDNKVILNLPSTVELSTPNRFADQVEYFCRNLSARDETIVSVHPHNDRGTGVAAAELALLAGAERVEGTLFGSGERTGNVDLVTVAMNLYTQGVAPGLDFSDIGAAKRVFERATGMRVYERTPYAGDLVFTAFSGSHQDAIRKGLEHRRETGEERWNIPYLPVDPGDLGRQYEPIIRINSQSGKGGAAYVLADSFGFNLPRAMHAEFGDLVKREADLTAAELTPEQLLRIFAREYRDVTEPYQLTSHDIQEQGRNGHSRVRFTGTLRRADAEHEIAGEGNGPIDAFFAAIRAEHVEGFSFASYHEHAIGSGSDAKAVAYIELIYRGKSVFGVGIESNVSIASIKGVLSAVNRALCESEQN